MHEQRVVPPRADLLVRERAHDALGVVQREARDCHVAHVRVHVVLELLLIDLGAALGLHVIGVEA